MVPSFPIIAQCTRLIVMHYRLQDWPLVDEQPSSLGPLSSSNVWENDKVSGEMSEDFFESWTFGNLVESLTKISCTQRQGAMVERKKPMALWREEGESERRGGKTQD